MSWIRSAVTKAVEAGGNTTITRTVRSYADSVVLHAGNAVAEGAKIIQDRIGARDLNSFRSTVKRLEEVSVSCKGPERVQLMRRWLVALKEIERLSSLSNEPSPVDQNGTDENKDSPKKPTMVYYVDPELGTMNFRDVFLYSQALEGITLSMILEAPNEEEVPLLLEIFGLCLSGGKDVHKAVIRNIQELATKLSSYQDEVLIKREELLQYAQGAIAGIRINADIARIDAKASNLMEEIEKAKISHQSSDDNTEKSPEKESASTTKAREETVKQFHLCSMLEALLLKKKSLSNGDTPEVHAQKVEKLRILSESLLNSISQAEKRILDQRSHKEEALNFRVAKAYEIDQQEKELVGKISELEKQQEELEAELRKVNASLSAARSRLKNAREERDNFDEASNQILIHLKVKEDELSRAVTSCKAEADVVNTWINFLEDTWFLRTTYVEQKEKQLNGDLEKYGNHFVNVVHELLTAYTEELRPSIIRIREVVGNLNSCQLSDRATTVKDEDSKSQRKNLELEYLDFEARFISVANVVDNMKTQFYIESEGVVRKDEESIGQLFAAFEKIKEEFESIERPFLEIENPKQSESSDGSNDSPSNSPKHTSWTPENRKEKIKGSFRLRSQKSVVTQAYLDELDSDPGKDGRGSSHSSEDIGEWVFDELVKDVSSSK
ncbi:hypothetical protein Tsubulata_005519 [Turnera subulata]|uniref:Uncharacterized protein n=1 Tax=Turnera subulata TaxID=218843 RepID=A0A9Q0FGU7_9ROSI|nr:hypothetical protein Tsubulata_005519 [Turnera subulata]